jgi:predicted enzyme related to lactoylglutathione lyase
MTTKRKEQPVPIRDGFIAGVPCFADTVQPDPDAAAAFYGDLFGWEFENVMPPGARSTYLVGRLRGGDVGAVGSIPEGAPPAARWRTYIAVESADETADSVRAAGGAVIAEPVDVGDAGRTAAFADPEGALFHVWQAYENNGWQIVNEHGAAVLNTLNTRDPDAAGRFYGAVFGWGTFTLAGGREMWTKAGYGDHLGRANPPERRRLVDMGAPDGFEDVVAAVNPIPEDRPELSPFWDVTFAVDDADAIAQRAAALGGAVVAAPFDLPWVRLTVLADPQGATFTASQLVPENN